MKRFKEIYRIVFIISSILVGLDAIGVKPEVSNPAVIEVLKYSYYILFGFIVIYAIIFFIKLLKNKIGPIKQKEQSIASETAIPQDLSELLDRIGITDIHFNKTNTYEKLTNKLSKSVEKQIDHIWILVYHGQQMLTYIKEPLSDAIGGNTKVHLLIASEDSDFMNEVWEMEENIPRINRGSIEEGKHKQITAFNEINIWKNTITKAHGNSKSSNFEIKEYNTQARYALILVDGKEEKWAWWTPYHPGIQVSETVSFILEGKGFDNKGKEDIETIYSQCRDHFKTLWDIAKPWKYPKEKTNGNA